MSGTEVIGEWNQVHALNMSESFLTLENGSLAGICWATFGDTAADSLQQTYRLVKQDSGSEREVYFPNVLST